ncbi:MAG: ATP-dependent metallopeptidase FtsH/Yme1/Tma family protein [Nitrospirae bacterium]|nr:ATP-dependent metallopeptidase FtsH/Yme1/Tma family protein [Nitrospirota bacterium]
MDKEKKQQPWPLIWIAAAILSMILFFFFSSSNLSPTSGEQVSYSEFKKMIEEKKFEEVFIEQNNVRGIIKEKDKKKEIKAVKVEDPELIKLLEKNNIKFSGKETDTWLRDFILAWVIPIVIFILIWRFLLGRLGAGPGVMAVGKSKASLYIEKDTGVTFNDVAGVDEAKEELKEVIDFLQHPDKYLRLGGKIPKGVLLVGPTGTGKTLLAKAVAGEAKVPFFSISGSEFVEMFVGVGAARVRDLFAQAEQKAPCIIFIDEIDALGKARIAAPIGGGYEEREHTLQQLLVEMDGFDTKKGIIIMAATNRPEILDPALLRPGRFDRHILVDRPDIKGREEILKVHAKNVKLSKDLDLKIIAARTPGFAGADLANVVNEAAILAARKDKNAVELSDFEEAINRAIAGLEKKKKVISKREQEIIAYHESGHAIAAESVPHADKVHRVSIIPRGIAALGYTLQLPTEDRYLLTKAELLDRLAVLMGGRAAEEIVFNEVSTGAQNDLERATGIARSMVVEYGMSEKLGPVTFERGRKPLFLDTGYMPTTEFSDETSRLIDEEVSNIVKETYSRVKKILEEKKDKLLILGKMLIEKEVIEGDELRRILATDN